MNTPSITEVLATFHEQVAIRDAADAAANQAGESLSTAVGPDGQPLPDGIYSEDADPPMVLVKRAGAMTFVKPTSLRPR